MGISMGLQAASDEKIDELANDANALNKFIRAGGREESANGDALRAILANGSALNPQMKGLFNMFSSFKESQKLGPSLDLGKGCHGLHYLFSGSPYQGREPQCFLMHGGRVIGKFEREFDVRAITSRQLVAFSHEIQTIEDAELTRRYNGKAMIAANIYPVALWADDNPDGLTHLCAKLSELKRFLKCAKDLNEGMIMCAR